VTKAHFAVRSARPGFAALNNVRAAVPILRLRCCWRHTHMLCAKRLAKRCDRAMGGPASSQPALPKACTRPPKAVFYSLRVRLPTARNEGPRSPDPSACKPGRKRADPAPPCGTPLGYAMLSWLYCRWRFRKLVKTQQVFKAPFALESTWTTPVFFGSSRCLCFRN
jgi:hypothetical protein